MVVNVGLQKDNMREIGEKYMKMLREMCGHTRRTLEVVVKSDLMVCII